MGPGAGTKWVIFSSSWGIFPETGVVPLKKGAQPLLAGCFLTRAWW
jgi:hypothetical protein